MKIKPDDLAFANEQLAGMLKSGLPLEGSLRELAGSMQNGPLRAELEALEQDLANGTSMADALDGRDLPVLYKKMLCVGAEANNLPAVLQWLADHYARAHTTWVRLKGLMVYPLLVLLTATALSFGITWVMNMMLAEVFMVQSFIKGDAPVLFRLYQWGPPALLSFFTLGMIGLLISPIFRRKIIWRLPAFREARLSRIADAMAILLRGGCSLRDSLALVRELETDNAAGAELAQWSERLERGEGKPEEFAKPGKVFPPLFTWTVRSGGEELATGFERAAELYHTRQSHRADAFLFAALPMVVLALGLLIMVQVLPLMITITRMMDALGS